LHLPADVREEILASGKLGGSGRERTKSLFRLVQGRAINHTTVRTVAMGQDAGRRVREARSALRHEGILVLGPDEAPVARALGLPEPRAGEWISQKVTRLRPDHGDAPSADLTGDLWTKAAADDPVEEAPKI
ncbi:NaeI family type II restriction endonuclease, partial [Streptomyces sp. NPDC001436]